MKKIFRVAGVFGAVVALSWAAAPLAAQTPTSAPQQVISANPFGLLLELFNAEYERVATTSSTVGVGGSSYFGGSEDYINGDVFWRYYPGGEPFDGWAFGAKIGVTDLPDDGTFFGMGFDVNRSWLLGAANNFYVGAGFGLKRLYATGDADIGLEVIPSIRIVNVGFAF